MTLSYEQCKNLKEKGFKLLLPSGSQRSGLCKHNIWGFEDRESCDCTPKDHAPVPTLEELIEACGKKIGFELLEEWIDNEIGYKAISTFPNRVQERGKTPIEAVYNLYMKL